MSLDKAELRGALEASYQTTRALLSRLTEADLPRPTANPKWRVHHLAAHLAETDSNLIFVGKSLGRGKNVRAPGFVINLSNWWSVRKHNKDSPATMVTVLDEQRRKLLAWLDGLEPEAFDRGGEVSLVGKVTLGQFLMDSDNHAGGHRKDIENAILH